PGVDEIPVQAGMEPGELEAARGTEDEERPLGGRVPEPGEVDDVPAIAQKRAVDPFLLKPRLQTLDGPLVPDLVQAIEDGRPGMLRIALEQGLGGAGRRGEGGA